MLEALVEIIAGTEPLLLVLVMVSLELFDRNWRT